MAPVTCASSDLWLLSPMAPVAYSSYGPWLLWSMPPMDPVVAYVWLGHSLEARFSFDVRWPLLAFP